jgi:hypothetical protein
MANLILSNNSSQVETTISQSYCRLTGSFAGPLLASAQPNSGFLIQNGNKQSGLFIGNTCNIFYNNCLNFDPSNTNVIFNIPDTKCLIVTGNGSIMTFDANGTFAVGTAIDSNFKGLQVVNSSPILLLKDTDTVNQSQAISFYDSSANLHTSLFNEPSASINTGGLNPVIGNATNLIYNRFFKLKNNSFNSSTNTFVSSGCFLTLFSGDCLNCQFNFSVGGSSFFSSDLTSNGIFRSSGLCVVANNSNLIGSGDNVAFNICNNKSNSTGSFYFYNPSGGLHSSINVNQTTAGDSEINFYVTPLGSYNAVDRRTLALEISGNGNSKFYGCILGETGYFNGFIRVFGIENSGCRTFLGRDGTSFHYFGSNSSNCSYGTNINANSVILGHSWLTSGRTSMCLESGQNLTVTGCLMSSGINSNSSLIVNNLYNTDSCISSRCITFRASGANPNIVNCGSFINYGPIAIFSGICSTGNQLNNISGCICLSNNLYVNSICMTAGNGICGPSGCFTTCMQTQVVCSNSCVRADSICSIGTTQLNCFATGICSTFIQSQNTAKAWGNFQLIDGVASNCCGYNFNSLIICTNSSVPTGTINFIYGLKLTNGIKYPFALHMTVMPKGTFAWNPSLATGSTASIFSTYGNGSVNQAGANMPNFIVPICSGVTSAGIAQAYVVNSVYCDLFFTVLNCKYLTSTFSEMCENFHDANIMFTIYSS